jgi:hypothetical protein
MSDAQLASRTKADDSGWYALLGGASFLQGDTVITNLSS